MLLTTRVRVVLAETPNLPLLGVQVALYDRDEGDADDHLGDGVTDDRGEILFSYDSDAYTDAEDKDDWRASSLPDLYVIVTDADGQVVLNTRDQALQDQLPRRLTVPIPRALAEQHGLLRP